MSVPARDARRRRKRAVSTQRASVTQSTLHSACARIETLLVRRGATASSSPPSRESPTRHTDIGHLATLARSRRNACSAALPSCSPCRSARQQHQSSFGQLPEVVVATVFGPCHRSAGPTFRGTVAMRSSGPTLPNISSRTVVIEQLEAFVEDRAEVWVRCVPVMRSTPRRKTRVAEHGACGRAPRRAQNPPRDQLGSRPARLSVMRSAGAGVHDAAASQLRGRSEVHQVKRSARPARDALRGAPEFLFARRWCSITRRAPVEARVAVGNRSRALSSTDRERLFSAFGAGAREHLGSPSARDLGARAAFLSSNSSVAVHSRDRAPLGRWIAAARKRVRSNTLRASAAAAPV